MQRAGSLPLLTMQRTGPFETPGSVLEGTNDRAMGEVKRTLRVLSKCRNVQTCEPSDTRDRALKSAVSTVTNCPQRKRCSAL
jgi:hypothetical protein